MKKLLTILLLAGLFTFVGCGEKSDAKKVEDAKTETTESAEGAKADAAEAVEDAKADATEAVEDAKADATEAVDGAAKAVGDALK